MAAPEGLRIDTLDPQQLVTLKERLEGDIQRMVSSNVSLQRAAGAFGASGKAIETLKNGEEGQTLMLPLTSSLYVAGKVATTDKVLVDVGTGYWVEMSSAAGVDYCKRKVTALKENIEGLSGVIRERQSGLMQVNQLLSEKMAAIQAAQAAQAKKTAGP